MMSRRPLLVVLVVLTGVGLFAVLADFWKPIFWGIIFAVLFKPFSDRLSVRMGNRRSVAAALTIVVVTVGLFIPAIYVGGAIIGQALGAVGMLQSEAVQIGDAIETIEHAVLALFGSETGTLAIDTLGDRAERAISGIGTWFVNLALGAGQGAAVFVVQLGLMLYLLFFLLRDGDSIYRAVFESIPLGGGQKERFFERFAVVTVATIKGTLIVSLVQGALGGIIFALLGISGALFWAAVMSILAILPAVGAAIIWFPAAVILALGGDWGKAVTLIAFGVLVISVVDNLLRPMLVGHDTRMPDWLVLFATVGGLSTFGISGFVAGPVIAALFVVSWQMLSESIAGPG
jgi:predicted PurR-regulated permease PerM